MWTLAVAILAYVFVGFFVYWLVTGSWTVGDGGDVSDLGVLVWVGPLFVWGGLYAVGPRGRLAALWYPAGRVFDSQTLPRDC